MKFSHCLPRRIGDEAALHFSIDVELRRHAHVQTIPILGSDNDFYYVNMTGISLAGSVLPIDLALFGYDGMGITIDLGSPGQEGCSRKALSVAFHFDGRVNLQLTESLTFYAFHDLGEYYLIDEDREVGGNILGAYQQLNSRFLYDVGAKKLYFAPEVY
ncbi:hypothetical protein PS1_033704 [Malus domestica]